MNRLSALCFCVAVFMQTWPLRSMAADRSILAGTPPMGWHSWNAFEKDIDEKKIRAIADAMATSGMRDAGYGYLVIDDACQGDEPAGSSFDCGGPLTELAALGNIAMLMPGTELQWDSKRMTFPSHPEADQHLHHRYRDGWNL